MYYVKILCMVWTDHVADDKSHIVTGEGLSKSSKEAYKIHSENKEKLAAMPEQEILEEQAKLLKSLG